MELCCTDDSMRFVKVKVVVYTHDEQVYSKGNCFTNDFSIRVFSS